MKMILLVTSVALGILGSLLGCAGAACETMPADTLVYETSGGFAGNTTHVDIEPDGSWTETGALAGDKNGRLTAEQMSELDGLLANWCVLPPILIPTPCCDIPTTTIRFRGKTVQYGLSTGVPPSVLALSEWIEDLVRDAP